VDISPFSKRGNRQYTFSRHRLKKTMINNRDGAAMNQHVETTNLLAKDADADVPSERNDGSTWRSDAAGAVGKTTFPPHGGMACATTNS